jgi:hypothetical protein
VFKYLFENNSVSLIIFFMGAVRGVWHCISEGNYHGTFAWKVHNLRVSASSPDVNSITYIHGESKETL